MAVTARSSDAQASAANADTSGFDMRISVRRVGDVVEDMARRDHLEGDDRLMLVVQALEGLAGRDLFGGGRDAPLSARQLRRCRVLAVEALVRLNRPHPSLRFRTILEYLRRYKAWRSRLQHLTDKTLYARNLAGADKVVLVESSKIKGPQLSELERRPTSEQLRMRLASVILEAPSVLDARDSILLLGQSYAVYYLYPSLMVEREPLPSAKMLEANIAGVMIVVAAASEIARRAGLSAPNECKVGKEFFDWTLEELHSWEEGIEEGSPRAEEIERQFALIHHAGVFSPNRDASSITLANVLAASMGEDYDRGLNRIRNGEFAGPKEDDPDRGRRLGPMLRFLVKQGYSGGLLKWSKGGVELDRKVLASITKSVLGNEPRRKKKETASYDEGQVRAEEESRLGGPLSPEVLADLRDLRDAAAELPEFRDLIEHVFGADGIRESTSVLAAQAGLHRLLMAIKGAEPSGLKAALLHTCFKGPRRVWAERFSTTEHAMRHFEDRARQQTREILRV